jgi:tRNA(fMet)-specific endonuclease VapC
LLESIADASIGIAAITASELLHGCRRARTSSIRAKRLAYVESLLDAIPVVPFGLVEARHHADLWTELVQKGEPIGPHDMLIGATALAQGHRLATLNHREFSRIPGLTLLPIDRFRVAPLP